MMLNKSGSIDTRFEQRQSGTRNRWILEWCCTRTARKGILVLYMLMRMTQACLSFCFIMIRYSLGTIQIVKNEKFMSDSVNIQCLCISFAGIHQTI